MLVSHKGSLLPSLSTSTSFGGDLSKSSWTLGIQDQDKKLLAHQPAAKCNF